MNRSTLAIVLFFAIGIGLYWQVHLKKNHSDIVVQNQVQQPDFVANNLNSVTFNDKGNVESRVSAAHMEHFDASNLTKFTQPVYLLYPDDGMGQWRIQAKEGTLDKTSGKLVLANNVVIDAISPDEPIQQLDTSYLELDLNTMIMTSDQEIYVKGTDFNIQGKGLYADLNIHTVELLHQVTGTYEPN